MKASERAQQILDAGHRAFQLHRLGENHKDSLCRAITDAIAAHANEELERAAKVVHEHKLRVGFGPGVEENLIQMIYRLYDDLEAAIRALKE